MKLEEITTFASFTEADPTCIITNDEIQVMAEGEAAWANAPKTAHLQDSYVLVELAQSVNGVWFYTEQGPGNYTGFSIYGDVLGFIEAVSGIGEDNTTTTYDPVAHRWLKLRETDGHLYWETSPTGINGSWTIQRTKVDGRDYSLNESPFVYTDSNSGTAIFRHFNDPPPPPVSIQSYYDTDNSQGSILDRIRWTVIEVNSNEILTRDLVVKEPEVQVNLSAPSIVSFKIDQGQQQSSAYGINWKNYGQWIVPEIETLYYGKICLGAQLVTDNKVDPQSGDMLIDATGFMGYPHEIPWLENFNPIAVDPAEVIQRIWAHIQSFVNANLGVDVQPSSTGTQMLPGIGFDGNILSFDFFAMFIRAVDFPDCGDQINSLARDLPLDLFEEVAWNTDRTEITKTLRIAYPLGGIQQDGLSFRLGENIINAELAEELDIEPVSDVIIRGWLPGRVYSSQLSNFDMTRARRVVMEEDAQINGIERAAAWAKRKLTRRNIPISFSKITIDPNHPHAPFGSFGVGDSIYIEAPNFPWKGDIRQWHRVTYYKIKEGEPYIEVGVKVDGAFNYDPIEYDPDAINKPPEDPNILPNGYFTNSLAGWKSVRGSWIRIATVGYSGEGSVRIDCDDHGEEFQSAKITVTPGETLQISAAVRYQEIVQTGTPPYTFAVAVNTHKDGGDVVRGNIVDSFVHDGVGPFTPMSDYFVVPNDDTVNEISVSLLVNSAVTGGVAFWDDVRVIRP